MLSTISANLMFGMAAWDIGSFLNNAKSLAQNWGGLLIMLLGAIGVVAAAVIIIVNLIKKSQNGQGAQVSWVWAIILLVIGGAALTGGWNLFSNVASGGQKTIEALGTGATWLPTLFM